MTPVNAEEEMDEFDVASVQVKQGDVQKDSSKAEHGVKAPDTHATTPDTHATAPGGPPLTTSVIHDKEVLDTLLGP